MEITRKEEKIEFIYNIVYPTDKGWVSNVRLDISIHYKHGFVLYYDLYQELVVNNTTKTMKIYEYQYEVKEKLLYFLVFGLYKKQVCCETKTSYENYLFNLFNDKHEWIENLPENQKEDNTYYKKIGVKMVSEK